MTRLRSAAARASLLLVVLFGLWPAGCSSGGDVTEPTCSVIGVSVRPTPVTLLVGDTTRLTATVSATNCATAPLVTWTSSNPAAVSLQASGNSALATALLTTAGAVSVSASTAGVAGNAAVTVQPQPALHLAPDTVSFAATEGGANPASRAVAISNGGGGTVSGLSVGSITYGAGAGGWLQAPTLSATSAPATLTLRALTGSLTPGTYTATVPVQSSAPNGPQAVAVTFTVAPPPPAIALSPTSLAFRAVQARANPASQAVTITNGGSGTLSGLGVGTISYGAGASGWLGTPALSGTTANPAASLTVQPDITGLTAGTYTATIPVTSGVAGNSPRNLPVTLTVDAAPDPCLFANATPIAVGDTVADALDAASCVINYRYADLYVLTLPVAASVQIDFIGTGFDAELLVLDYATGTQVLKSSYSGPGLADVRVSKTLAAGQYVLQAQSYAVGGSGSYTLSVVPATVGSPSRMLLTGNGQRAAPGAATAINPTVTVTDSRNLGVAGVTVDFAIVPGVGSITTTSMTTGPDGIATAGTWTLAAGPNVLSATGRGLIIGPAFFTATGTTATGYNLDLRFLTMPTAPQLAAFAAATARWQAIITGDVADIPAVLSANACAANSPAINETIDDLIIQVRLGPIDGPGGVLGAAGPCFIRTAGSLPVLGAMVFDTADLAVLEADGSLDEVMLHEMGHVIGIGSLWIEPAFNFLKNPSLPDSAGIDTYYSGANGRAGFDSIGGTAYTLGQKVPVENALGGQGTRDAHWREGVLDNELMTGFLDAGANPLSLLTVRSLQDFGYVVNTAAADPFFLVLHLMAGTRAAPGRPYGDDVRRGPVYRIDREGRVFDRAGRRLDGVFPAAPR